MNTSLNGIIKVRALRTKQGRSWIYTLFIPGNQLTRVADIRRIERDSKAKLQGFQRKEIRDHVNEIAAYLGNEGVLFPNAIILALSSEVKFKQSRGPTSNLTFTGTDAGQLEIPIRSEGERAAWIVDGQQRSLALEKVGDAIVPVPVVAFESESLETQREQFILVNRARPLPQRLIDELLPQTSGDMLPRDLQLRKLPSTLCDVLNRTKDSPFFRLIKRSSSHGHFENAVVADAAIIHMIKRSLDNPNGALAIHKIPGQQKGDSRKMAAVLKDYWCAVRDTFPDAWGEPPEQSRLMHSAGIAAMGDLMDRIAARADSQNGLRGYFRTELGRIAKDCAWTKGTWPAIRRAWDEIESTPKDIKTLSQLLVQMYAEKSRQ